jgi:uncharacterized protein
MEINRENPPLGPIVKGFAGRGFRVGETVYEDGLWLDPSAARAWQAPATIETLAVDDLAALIATDPQPEFLLLGTGARLVQPSRALVRAMEDRGIGVEAMDSRAAARAWGVLRQEERWIVAALMPL